MTKVVDHPCGECQLGKNAPFSQDICDSVLATTLLRGAFTCHWTERGEREPRTPQDCFYSHLPLCATGVAMVIAESKKPNASQLIKDEAAKYMSALKVSVLGPSDVLKIIPPNTTFTVRVESPFGPGSFQVVKD